jgi:hypothetical protein
MIEDMKKEFPKISIYIVVYVVVALLLGIKVILDGGGLLLRAWSPMFLWILGGIVGYLIYELDRIVDIYIANPQTKLALWVRHYFTLGKYGEGWKLIKQNKKLQSRLVIRSALFQAIWVFLAIFVLTSTLSLFGKGFILGLGLRLLLEEWGDYLSDKEYLREWLFWQMNLEITDKRLKYYMIGISILVGSFFLSIVRI